MLHFRQDSPTRAISQELSRATSVSLPQLTGRCPLEPHFIPKAESRSRPVAHSLQESAGSNHRILSDRELHMAARKFLILLCSVFALINISPQFPWNSAFAAEQKSIEPDLAKIGDSKVWKLVGLEATTAEKGGKRLANLKTLPDENGSTDHISMALLSGVEFNTGTIELDLRGRGDTLRCFLGVCFHVEDEKTHEAVYFRPFNFKAKDDVARSHGVQYISLPDHTWERLRKEHE